MKVKPSQNKINPELFKNSCQFDESFKVRGSFHLCTNCHKLLTDPEKPKRPKISAMNGLLVDDIPQSLQLTDVENQLIAINLLFMKLKKLPKSRMGCMVDRVINVPLSDEQVTQSVKTLPRSLDDGYVVPIQFKRMKEMKNTVMEAFVRPKVLIDALQTLKELGNPHYQNITIDFDYYEKTKTLKMKSLMPKVKPLSQMMEVVKRRKKTKYNSFKHKLLQM